MLIDKACNGVSKIIWSHVRDMRVDMSKDIIRYSIPVIQEKPDAFIRVEKTAYEILVYFVNKDPSTAGSRYGSS